MGDRPVSVLLIEDDEDDYLLTKELFAELAAGVWHLDRVADYDSAVHAFSHCNHDLYLMDYRLGSRNGLELLAEAQRLGCQQPMIMLTGQRERAVDLLAMQAGAVDFLVKDKLDAPALDRAMRYALQRKRLEEEILQANQMLEQRVERRTAELARLNEQLQAEVAIRARAEEALRQVDRRKDQFLATLAHELRNPLSPLTASTQLIGLDPENAAQVRELAVVMARQLEQLNRLIDDLLDVSRITSGKLNLRSEPVALGAAIAAALDVSRPLMEASAHQLQVSLPPELLVVAGDKVRLSQIVGNLLINAAKYTPRGGHIELTVRREARQAVIRVRDNGIGIAPEMLPSIFDLFTQVDSSHTRSQGGLGIGLTLVHTLVAMHGGEVEAASEGSGQGSLFTVRLPLADAASGGRASPTTGESLSAETSLRVLVVDDNRSASHLLGRLLEKLGQQVYVTDSATTALAEVPRFDPDVVISDVAMPDVSGYELARRIRQLPAIRQPALIALTGYGQETDRQEALAAGFDQHLTKPIGLPALKALLETIARQRTRSVS